MVLAYDAEGAGPWVVLLHAGVADRRMWDPVVGGLEHSFSVVRPDLRGFGDSGFGPAGERYTDADDVAALLDHLGIVDAVVVGASFGGRVALELACAHPGRVRELVLLCPGLRGAPSTASSTAVDASEEALLAAGDVAGAVRLMVDTWLGPAAGDEARTALADMQRRGYEVQLAAQAAASAAGLPGPGGAEVAVDLGAIRVPTLVVSGAHDVDALQDAARAVASGVPGAELCVLDWAGHLPSVERPDVVLALLLDVVRDDPGVHAP